jgi:hypothetical protein
MQQSCHLGLLRFDAQLINDRMKTQHSNKLRIRALCLLIAHVRIYNFVYSLLFLPHARHHYWLSQATCT